MTYSDHLEDSAPSGRPADPGRQLGDNDLRAGGLAPVQAWMRKPSSPNARRVAKAREKRNLAGVNQVNVQVPEYAREAIKTLAKHLTEGGNLADWAAQHVPSTQVRSDELTAARAEVEALHARLAAAPPATPDLSSQPAEAQTQLAALGSQQSAAKRSKAVSPEVIEQNKKDRERGRKVRLAKGWRRYLAHIAGWLDKPQGATISAPPHASFGSWLRKLRDHLCFHP